jgi:hypothetical protein
VRELSEKCQALWETASAVWIKPHTKIEISSKEKQMKGLKKIALCSAVALAPFAANADLKALDDSAMGSVTGQAGVTIDLSANVSIGEIAYEDQGFLALSNVRLAGADLIDPATGGFNAASKLDDIRLTIDVAGDATGSDLGTAALGATYLTDVSAAGFDVQNLNETAQDVSDGDLVISLRSQSGGAVDYGLFIGEVSLNKSANSADIGSFSTSGDKGTVLVSNLFVAGAIGPIDIVVQEESNSMNINAFFSAQGNLNLPFMGTSLDFELHNRRGNSVVNASAAGVSFAHAQVDVGTAVNAAGDDALRVTVQDFSGDLDLLNVSPGAVSIGNIYMTDLAVTADMTIYGH